MKKIKKCKYYNNAQTASTLMIDDLSFLAVTKDGVLKPWNDWGFGLDKKNSLYRYFYDNLLIKYPEIKGTFFYATKTHKIQNLNSGYKFLNRDIDNECKRFINDISTNFEMAFHGTTHGKFANENSLDYTSNYQQEFEYLTMNDIKYLQNEIARVEEQLEMKFSGGKYCGYKKNDFADSIIEELGFKWWASSANMINKKHYCNKHSYFGDKNKVFNMPTNISGGIFNRKLVKKNSKRKLSYILRGPFNYFKKEHYIQYLYENGLIISIQEHFQNQRTDGRRQQPNVFDDINSLDAIFNILRGSDVWYATCSEIAHYLESYDYTDLQIDDNIFKLIYKGRWSKPFLSIMTNSSSILELESGKTIRGIFKDGNWIYNNLNEGGYKTL